MKIGIDIDEVLADGLGAFLNYFNRTYGTSLTKENFKANVDFWETLGIKSEDRDEFYKRFDSDPAAKDWYLIPGAKEGISRLKQEGHEMIVISNRRLPRLEPSKIWLEKNFPGAFSGVYFTESEREGDIRPTKAVICKRHGVQVLLEDNWDEALECTKVGIGVVLFDTYLNQKEISGNVVRVFSWDEAVRVVDELSEKRKTRGS